MRNALAAMLGLAELGLAGGLAGGLVVGLGGCSSSFARQSITDSFTPASPAEIAAEHQPDTLRADLDALVALHERACPDPYLHASKESIAATCERLKASIDHPMRRREFYRLVMELQASYGVDHILQTVAQEDLKAALDAGELLLPFRAEPDGDHLVVRAVSPSLPPGTGEGEKQPAATVEGGLEPGDRILSLGGTPASEIIARLRALVPAESERFQRRRIVDSFRSYAWAAGIAPPISAEVLGADGSRRTLTLTGVGANARKDERTAPAAESAAGATASAPATSAPNGAEIVLVDDPPFRCTLIDGSIARIDFPTMSMGLAAQWNAFLDRAFTEISSRPCDGLIVDIRRNGGGDSGLGEALLSRLTDRPYRLAAGMVWRKSDEGYEALAATVKPFWRWLVPIGLSFGMPEYSSTPTGGDLTFLSDPVARPRVEPGFTGPTCLLIGEGTFSSAMMLADGTRTYDLMTTVGEPTGGLPTSLGELGFWTLPSSRIRVQFCQKKFLRASGDQSDAGPVVPHIVVSPVNDRDAALERAIEVIRARAATTASVERSARGAQPLAPLTRSPA